MCFIFYSGPKSGQDSLEGGSWGGTFKVPLPTPQDIKLIYLCQPFWQEGLLSGYISDPEGLLFISLFFSYSVW